MGAPDAKDPNPFPSFDSLPWGVRAEIAAWVKTEINNAVKPLAAEIAALQDKLAALTPAAAMRAMEPKRSP